jgi:hypothetical protein
MAIPPALPFSGTQTTAQERTSMPPGVSQTPWTHPNPPACLAPSSWVDMEGDKKGEQGDKGKVGGPNDMSFGPPPPIHFFSSLLCFIH